MTSALLHDEWQIRAIYAGQHGWAELTYIDGDPLVEPMQRDGWYRYPEQLPAMLQRARQLAERGYNLYIGRTCYAERRRHKADALPSRAIFLDDAPAGDYTLTVQSSATSQQAWLLLDQAADVATIEDLQRRAAYALGADHSGWDATQLVRLVGGYNTKRHTQHLVTFAARNERRYTVAQLRQRWPAVERPAIVNNDIVLDQAAGRWLSNIAALLGADGLPKRLSARSKTRQMLASGDVWADTSAQRYSVARGLMMHGYPDDELAALLIHFTDYGSIKGSTWLYEDIGRVISKLRLELRSIAPSPTRAALTIEAHPLPRIERRRSGRPRAMTPDQYLAWLRSQVDAGGLVMQSQRQIAAALGKGIATIRRWEKALASQIERRTFSHRHDSYLAILGAINIPESIAIVPADVVLSIAAAQPIAAPETAIGALSGETHPPDRAPAPVAPGPRLVDLVREAFDMLAADGQRFTASRVRRYVLVNAGRAVDAGAIYRLYQAELKRRQRSRQDTREERKARSLSRSALARKARSLATQAAAVFLAVRDGVEPSTKLSFELDGKVYTTRAPRQLTEAYGFVLKRLAGIYAAEEARRDALAAQQVGDYTPAEQAQLLAMVDEWRGQPPRDMGAAAEQAEIGARWAAGERGGVCSSHPAPAPGTAASLLSTLYRRKAAHQEAQWTR